MCFIPRRFTLQQWYAVSSQSMQEGLDVMEGIQQLMAMAGWVGCDLCCLICLISVIFVFVMNS